MQKMVKAETDRLEHELRGYKNNLIKESIRVRRLCWGIGAAFTDCGRWEMRILGNIITKLAISSMHPRPILA